MTDEIHNEPQKNIQISFIALRFTDSSSAPKSILSLRVDNLTDKIIRLYAEEFIFICNETKIQRKSNDFSKKSGYNFGDEIYPNCAIEISVNFEYQQLFSISEKDLIIAKLSLQIDSQKISQPLAYQITSQDVITFNTKEDKEEKRYLIKYLNVHCKTQDDFILILDSLISKNLLDENFMEYLLTAAWESNYRLLTQSKKSKNKVDDKLKEIDRKKSIFTTIFRSKYFGRWK